MNIQQYISNVSSLFNTGKSTEHSYRGDLQQLLTSLLKDVSVTNEPKRIDCGAPDYILTRKDVPIGYIEAKDVGVKLGDKAHKEQFDRYKSALNNLIITDYLEFHFYKNAVLVDSVTIATIENGKIYPKPDSFDRFTALIENFALQITQSIKSPTTLAQMMAAKAKLMAQVIKYSLDEDDKNQINSDLKGQMAAFKSILIHDITNASFADIYAQTIVYGLFAARYHDTTLETFSRQEAATLIPQSNPFLRKLFQYIAGYELDSRLVWLVEELVQIFLATDVASVMHNFGTSTRQHDPIIHFYETFLAEYDPALRKSRGVWYTPEPVVSFIVRAVDDILKSHFDLPQGLADTSKTTIKVKTDKRDGRTSSGYVEIDKEIHRVQILDPATGTGTFLAQTIRHIYDNQFLNMQGAWSGYIKDHLLPRLNGFELLMTSYAMAHLKLDMLLTETGYKPDGNPQRLRIYLTNSLEEHHPDTGTLFSSWLSTEANEANHIKRDAPVMVVMGNPPYSGISSNNGDWIAKLIDDYKYVDGQYFNERKHWLNDDYVKFIRYGQHFIDKKGEGILAFINPHGFLDNPTFRGMRWNLLKSFDEIYVIDLHGNSKKKETAPDGTKDVNVFDIQQGVSINFFVKTGNKNNNELGVIYHRDVYGSRQNKYEFLTDNSWKDLDYLKVEASAPNYFFVPKNFAYEDEYVSGFKLGDLFLTTVCGIVTARDSLVIDFNEKDLINKMDGFADSSKSDDEVRGHLYGNKKAGKYLAGDSRGWKLSTAREKIRGNKHSDVVKPIAYRPFDVRQIYYSQDMVDWSRRELMENMLTDDSLSLVFLRQFKTGQNFQHIFITDLIFESCLVSNRTSEICYGAPLYLYSKEKDLLGNVGRTPNLNLEVVNEISRKLRLTFVSEKESGQLNSQSEEFAPIDLFDYIYSVLHSSAYRETYKEFLKIDFPRVPYPKTVDQFWQLVSLGKQLRKLHLLKTDAIHDLVSSYPEGGNNRVEKISYLNSRVYINETQFFEGVTELVWEFSIGAYQPAQKWLKDRKGRILGYEDILHYQRIIKAILETYRLMQAIDQIQVV